MYKLHFAIVSCLLLSIVSIVTTGCGATKNKMSSSGESAMDRILRTGTIRCSYLPYSSYFRKDPNTRELSGIFHDVMEEIGKNAGLKVEWTEEVGYENIFPGLDADRYDVFAAGLWPSASRAKAASFSTPVFYSAITAWGRPDNKFTTDLGQFNSSSVRIATIDGAMEDIIAKTDFPKAQRVSLPELSSFAQNLLNVMGKKADVTFAEPMVVNEFLDRNPGTIKQIAPEHPLRVFGNSLAIKKGETELKDFLDAALHEILGNGKVDKIIAKYKLSKGTIYPVARPYETP